MYELFTCYMHTETRKIILMNEIAKNTKRDDLTLPFSGPYPQDDAPEIK